MNEFVGEASDADFEANVITSKHPVLVDFWAEWCQPCKMISPVIEELAKEYSGRLKVMKVNIDASPEISVKYGVRSIPTLLLFNQGNLVATKVGALSKTQLEEFINENI